MSPTDSSTLENQTAQAVSSSQPEQPVTPIIHRPRRLRRTETLRRMVRETTLRVEDLIYPLFVMEGEGQREEVPSMPDCYRYTLDLLLNEAREVYQLGIGAIAFFDDNNYALREGDPTGERLSKIAQEKGILLMMCDRCALSRGLAKGEPGNCTPYSTVSGVQIGCVPDLYAALASNPPDQFITL